MSIDTEIRNCPPKALGRARAMTHRAVQLPSRAARANRNAREDESHASLVWDGKHRQFVTSTLAGINADYHLAVTLPAPDRPALGLRLLSVSGIEAQCSLDRMPAADASAWLDQQLQAVGLKPASAIALPYELPPEVASIEVYEADTDQIAALAGWFDLAATVLTEFTERHNGAKPGAGPIWVWPHHFDIASYVRLDERNDEFAPGIGVGMSPGDESYDQPYFYVNPWPKPDAKVLPDVPAPGHWHTTGFVGAIATAEALLATSDASAAALAFTNDAVAIAHGILGA